MIRGFKDGLSKRYIKAFKYAAITHSNPQDGSPFRKGTTIPYISHPMAVASIVMEFHGDEEEVIAALLHDLAEDHGGEARLEEIEIKFGSRVRRIVQGLSDDTPPPGVEKALWSERKEKYLAHLPTVDKSVMLVSAADKLHNIRSIVRDYRSCGESLWPRFNGGKKGTLWYYRTLAKIYLKGSVPKQLADEIKRNVDELDDLVSGRLEN